ncbi:MAG: MarR family transcriptional regulator, partial [Gemmatimonadaceae bacterium]|nr:MarR family transcriptional regulator [Gemmatimonadaceae bacterium]
MPRRLPTLPQTPPVGPLPAAVLTSIGFLANQVSMRLRARFEASLRDHGLQPRHFLLLTILRDEGTMPQHALGARAGLDRTTTMQAAQVLEDAGHLVRSDDPTDRRVYRVSLTPSGRQLVASLQGRIRRAEQDVLSALSADERAE